MRNSAWSSDGCSSDLVDEPHPLTRHLGIALGDRSFAEAQAIHLGARQRDPRLVDGFDRVIVPRAPVLGDGLHFLEGGGFGAGHAWARCRAGGAVREGAAPGKPSPQRRPGSMSVSIRGVVSTARYSHGCQPSRALLCYNALKLDF